MATKLVAAYNSFHVFPSSATLDGKFEVFPFMTACQSKGKTTKQAGLLTKGETETCPNISWTDICIAAWSRKILRKIKACLFHRHNWMTTAGFQSSCSVFRLHWCKICLTWAKKTKNKKNMFLHLVCMDTLTKRAVFKYQINFLKKFHP